MPGTEFTAAVRLSGQYRASSGLPAPGVVNLNLERAINFVTGTGAGAVGDTLYEAAINIAASGTSTLDLNAGGLVDAFGNTINLLRVKGILIFADATNTNDIVYGNAAATQFVGPMGAAAHTISVRPGGVFCDIDPGAGWTIVAATSDNIKLANSGAGTSVTGQLLIWGATA